MCDLLMTVGVVGLTLLASGTSAPVPRLIPGFSSVDTLSGVGRSLRFASDANQKVRATPDGWSTEVNVNQAIRNPDSPEMNRRSPDVYRVRLDTTRGPVVIEVRREWSPHGADRFYNLVAAGYYDDSRVFRVIKGKWAQFGINGDPAIARIWRDRTIPDDPRVETNARGTVAFAFAVPNGRTTQVFINLRDNAITHDKEPFVPFGRVVQGMDAVDALYSEYGESSGGGIRAGKQEPLFEGGNGYLDQNFPKLDAIKRATIEH